MVLKLTIKPTHQDDSNDTSQPLSEIPLLGGFSNVLINVNKGEGGQDQSCEGNLSGNTGSDVTRIPTMTSYLHHQWRHSVSGNVSYPSLVKTMLTLADTYRKTQILGHNIVIYTCISNLTVILHQNVKKNLRSYLGYIFKSYLPFNGKNK